VSKQSKQASKKAKQASNQPSKSKQRKPIAQQPKQATSQCYPASKKQKNKLIRLIRPAKNQAQTEALSLFRVCCLRSKSLLDNQVKQAKGNQQITSGDLPNNYQ
jgi:hypothetical protein